METRIPHQKGHFGRDGYSRVKDPCQKVTERVRGGGLHVDMAMQRLRGGGAICCYHYCNNLFALLPLRLEISQQDSCRLSPTLFMPSDETKLDCFAVSVNFGDVGFA